MKILRNRSEAGLLLAKKLKDLNLGGETMVLALPRGGVPVAWEIAKTLKAPLDLVLVKKIGAPGQPEVAIGAISTEGEAIWRDEVVKWFDLNSEDKKNLALQAQQRLGVQASLLRGDRPPPKVTGKTLIVVDDGLATGATMTMAIELLRKKDPQRIVVAVPVGPPSSVESLKDSGIEVVALAQPEPFMAVGQWYQNFDQVTDEEVIQILKGSPIG